MESWTRPTIVKYMAHQGQMTAEEIDEIFIVDGEMTDQFDPEEVMDG